MPYSYALRGSLLVEAMIARDVGLSILPDTAPRLGAMSLIDLLQISA
ncbi:MAG: hypothetical protein IIA64_12440 [Planctomycetes bacterium]|nr:hypothetical protein [Planctomycetota bacterium]